MVASPRAKAYLRTLLFGQMCPSAEMKSVRSSMVPAIAVGGQDTKAMNAGRMVAERLNKLLRDGKKSKNKDSKDVKGSASVHVVDQPDCAWFASLDTVDDEALLTCIDTVSVPELYDSGALQHLSPSRKCFLNFASIPPKPIWGANNSTFNAIGKNDLPIYLLNGSSQTYVLLKDVLYAPSMHVTLVSISSLTHVGCYMVFDGLTCQIFDVYKKLLGEVSVANGLYCT